MQEPENKAVGNAGEEEVIVPTVSAGAKLANFWYHYKAHSIVAVLVTFALVICLWQCAGNSKADIQFLYAGPKGIEANATLRGDLDASIKEHLKDYNEDGEVRYTAQFLVYHSPDALDTFEDENDRGIIAANSAAALQTFEQEIMAGECYLCFLDPSLFEYVYDYNITAEDGEEDVYGPGCLLTDMRDFLGEEAEVTYYRGNNVYGVMLSSTPLFKLPGFKKLPRNTVICLRKVTSFTELLGNGAEAQEKYNRQADFIKSLILGTPSKQ